MEGLKKLKNLEWVRLDLDNNQLGLFWENLYVIGEGLKEMTKLETITLLLNRN